MDAASYPPSPLLQLPGEIRGIIYKHVLFSPQGRFLDPLTGQARWCGVTPRTLERDTAILLACKTTFTEALPIYYHANKFLLSKATDLNHFARASGQKQLKLSNIEHVQLGDTCNLSRTRIKELKKLINLKTLTLTKTTSFQLGWSASKQAFPVVFAYNPTACTDDEKKAIAYLCARAYTMARELQEMMAQRPAINYEFRAVERVYPPPVPGVVYGYRSPVEVVVLFEVLWNEASQQYTFRKKDVPQA